MSINDRNGRTQFPFLVAIETDPERTPAELGGRPRMLNQGDAEQMLAHLDFDAGTGILDRYANSPLGRRGPDRHIATRRSELEGVYHKVGQDLENAIAIDIDGG